MKRLIQRLKQWGRDLADDMGWHDLTHVDGHVDKPGGPGAIVGGLLMLLVCALMLFACPSK